MKGRGAPGPLRTMACTEHVQSQYDAGLVGIGKARGEDRSRQDRGTSFTSLQGPRESNYKLTNSVWRWPGYPIPDAKGPPGGIYGGSSSYSENVEVS